MSHNRGDNNFVDAPIILVFRRVWRSPTHRKCNKIKFVHIINGTSKTAYPGRNYKLLPTPAKNMPQAYFLNASSPTTLFVRILLVFRRGGSPCPPVVAGFFVMIFQNSGCRLALFSLLRCTELNLRRYTIYPRNLSKSTNPLWVCTVTYPYPRPDTL